MDAVSGRRLVSPTLVGRDQEIELLANAVSAPPAVAVVEGEAGVGKTRLLTELAARPDLRELRFLVGGCLRIREPFPLCPLIEGIRSVGADLARAGLSPVTGALRPLLPELAHLLPEPPPPLADRAAERHRVFRALAEALAALGPAVLVVEDLHWADEQTVEFLGYLLRDPPPKLALVLTYRGDETDPDVPALSARLPASVGRVRLRLAALTVPEAGELAAAILGVNRVPADVADQLWRRTSGLPLALEELLALLRARGVPGPERSSGEQVRRALDELDVPTGIRDQVWQRVSRLSDPARSVVEAAAVLQTAVPLPVLTGTCRPPARRVRSGVEEALVAGVLVETPAGVGHRHMLAAQAVYEAVPGPRRRDLHRRAADALSSLPDPPLGQVAHHLRQAGASPAWVDTAERAADQARSLGHDDEAVRLLEDVVRHAELTLARRVQVGIQLGQAALEARHLAGGVVELLTPLPDAAPPGPARGELRLICALLTTRTGAEFARCRSLAAAAIPDLADPGQRAHAMAALAMPFVPGVPLREHRRWLARALATLPQVGQPEVRTFLHGKLAMILAGLGDPGWRPLADAILADTILADTGGRPPDRQVANAYFSVGFAACYAGDLRMSARLLAGVGQGQLDRLGYLDVRVRTASALLDFCRGSWGDGLAQRAARPPELGECPAEEGMQLDVVAAGLALARGELDRAANLLPPLLQRLTGQGVFDLLSIPAAAAIRLATGRGDAAEALARARWFLAAMDSVPFQVSAVRALPAVTEALLAAGEPAQARRTVHRYAQAVCGLDAPLAAAALPHARGLLAAAAGRWQAAAGYFQASGQRYEARWCPYEAAQARELAAPALLAIGEVAAAAEALPAALVTYQRLGAAWDFARAAGAARRLGLPVPAQHRGGHHGYSTDLSPRERQVAELAAAGRTNPEIAGELFVSVNTVKKQLAAAMRKLGVPSRVALAAKLAAAGARVDGPPGP